MKHNNPDHELYIPLKQTERQVHNAIKRCLEPDFICLTKKPYYYCMASAHWQNIRTRKIIHVFSNDLRESTLKIILRTAKNEKDYTGGRNNWTDLKGLREIAFELTRESEPQYKQVACM